MHVHPDLCDKLHEQSPLLKPTLTWWGSLSKRFHPMRQQEELVGATQLHLSRTNGSSYDNAKDLVQSGRIQIRVSLLIFSIFWSLVDSLSGPTDILYQYILSFRQGNIWYRFLFSCGWAGIPSLEVKYDGFKNKDEGTWQKCLV